MILGEECNNVELTKEQSITCGLIMGEVFEESLEDLINAVIAARAAAPSATSHEETTQQVEVTLPPRADTIVAASTSNDAPRAQNQSTGNAVLSSSRRPLGELNRNSPITGEGIHSFVFN